MSSHLPLPRPRCQSPLPSFIAPSSPTATPTRAGRGGCIAHLNLPHRQRPGRPRDRDRNDPANAAAHLPRPRRLHRRKDPHRANAGGARRVRGADRHLLSSRRQEPLRQRGDTRLQVAPSRAASDPADRGGQAGRPGARMLPARAQVQARCRRTNHRRARRIARGRRARGGRRQGPCACQSRGRDCSACHPTMCSAAPSASGAPPCAAGAASRRVRAAGVALAARRAAVAKQALSLGPVSTGSPPWVPTCSTPEAERALKPGDEFTECSGGCPTMVVVPAGKFLMGSVEGIGLDDRAPAA